MIMPAAEAAGFALRFDKLAGSIHVKYMRFATCIFANFM